MQKKVGRRRNMVRGRTKIAEGRTNLGGGRTKMKKEGYFTKNRQN